MKLTESQLRQIVREELVREIDSYQISQEYGNVADGAFEEAEQNPKLTLSHIMAIANLGENLAVALEQSELDRRDIKPILEAFADAGITAEQLNNQL